MNSARGGLSCAVLAAAFAIPAVHPRAHLAPSESGARSMVRAEGTCSIEPPRTCVPEKGTRRMVLRITAKPPDAAAVSAWPKNSKVDFTLFSGQEAVSSSKGPPGPTNILEQAAAVIRSVDKPTPMIVISVGIVISSDLEKLGDLRVEVRNKDGQELPCSERLYFTVFRVTLDPAEKDGCQPSVELTVTVQPTDIVTEPLRLRAKDGKGTFENGKDTIPVGPGEAHTLTMKKARAPTHVVVEHEGKDVFFEPPKAEFHACASGTYEYELVDVDPVVSPLVPPEEATNFVHNPAVIVIEETPDRETSAVIDAIDPGTKKAHTNPKIQWSVVTKEDDQFGAGEAEFFSGRGDLENRGPTARAFGNKEGRVEFQLSIGDAEAGGESGEEAERCAYYEAAVVKPRTIPYRVNILTDGKGAGSRFLVGEVADHLRTANLILRQAGVRLVKDPHAHLVSDGAKLIDEENAIFRVEVPTELTQLLEGFENELKSVQANMNKDVLNIVYIESHAPINVDGEDVQAAGLTLLRPGNRKDESVKLTYRPILEHKDPVERTMKVGLSTLVEEGPELGAFFVTDGAESYRFPGEVVAHETGHILTLLHRNEIGEFSDNLLEPGEGNLMHGGDDHVDIDLIQVLAIINSRVFPK